VSLSPDEVDALLPQTQCGLCGYGGCMPYAEALVYENAPINLCPPGGVKTLHALGALLQQDPTPHIPEMEQKTKPNMLAIIREDECIGCTKCIQACPVDAILGSAKRMHTIITDECTGCELCIPPCPVDCIDLVALSLPTTDEKRNLARQRFNDREARLRREQKTKQVNSVSVQQKKNYIEEAIKRAKAKRQ
jgi:electron transport complex protein RnfB